MPLVRIKAAHSHLPLTVSALHPRSPMPLCHRSRVAAQQREAPVQARGQEEGTLLAHYEATIETRDADAVQSRLGHRHVARWHHSQVRGEVFEFEGECAATATASFQLVEQPATHQYSE